MARLLSLVSFKIYPAHMGGQKGVALFYEHLRNYHQVFMAVSNDHKEGTTDTFPVQQVLFPNKKMLRNLFKLPMLAKWIKSNRIDCVIAEHSYTAWMAYLLRMITGKPFIIHSHNLEAVRFKQMGRSWWKIYWYFEKWIHQRANHNFFISEEDQNTAIANFDLPAKRCTVIPYGINDYHPIANARNRVRKELNLQGVFLFHFNGTMDYEPNVEAVQVFLSEIVPLLEQQNISFDLLLTGKRLPLALREEISTLKSVTYIEFVESIDLIYQASDLFLNPVTNTSGVKTKVIEAIGNQCKVVSFAAGATGIPVAYCGDYLTLVEDYDWNGFVAAVIQNLHKSSTAVPYSFYDYFAWKNSIINAASVIESVSRSCRRN